MNFILKELDHQHLLTNEYARSATVLLMIGDESAE